MIVPKEYIKRNGSKLNRIGRNVCVFLSNDSREFYEETIVKVAGKLGCTCKSFLDFPVGNGLENVWKNLVESGIIIVDITNYSPSVMFELGVALTYRDPQEVIIICAEKDRESSIPFNIGPMNINYYSASDKKLLKIFEKKLNDDMDSVIINYTIEDPIRDIEAKKLMEKALGAIDIRDWMVAEVLFTTIDNIEPNNWKITKEWARLLRLMGKSFQDAQEKLELALEIARHPTHKSEICLEFALLHDSSKDRITAERYLNQAEEWNRNDKNIYYTWINFYIDKDELHRALEKNLALLELDKKDKDAQLWFDYLSYRISVSSYKKTFEEYKRGLNIPTVSKSKIVPIKIPHNISWEEFKREYTGKIVYGQVDNIHERFGVYVTLNREFTGLIHSSKVSYELKNKLNPKLKIAVRIVNTFRGRDGKLKIDLIYFQQRRIN